MIERNSNKIKFYSYYFIGDIYIMEKVLDYLKKIIFSAFLLYGYNIIASNFNLVIPINIITIIMVTLLGAPGLFALILFKITSL